MLNFAYKGISQGKYVEGEIEAINNSEAAYKLKEQKVIITKLAQAKKKVVAKKKEPLNFSFGTGVKTKEILIFAKQFATMQRAGLPILTSLDLLISQTSGPALKKILGGVLSVFTGSATKIGSLFSGIPSAVGSGISKAARKAVDEIELLSLIGK